MSKNSHAELYYHFVWHTKNNKPLISQEWEDRLYGYINRKCTDLAYQVMALGGIDNHIHILLRANPDMVPAEIVKRLKGASSHFVNEFSLCAQPFYWQEGYGVFSVSTRDVEMISQYIRNQKSHHAEKKIRDDWEIFEGHN